LGTSEMSREPVSRGLSGAQSNLGSGVGGAASNVATLLAALGGRVNVRAVEVASTRLRISVSNSSIVDSAAIRSQGLRGVAIPSPGCVHVVVGPAASETGLALRQLLA